LVIVTQENKLLANYAWLARRMAAPVKVAYWGHGANFQSDAPSGLREKWKRLLLTRVDWWFAYTDLTRDIVLSAGYPAERITVLDNAIDNEAFRAGLDSISKAEADALREKVSHGGTPRIGLFCGSLYPDKRIDYMIEAADRIHAAMPGFSLVVIGDGPSAAELKSAATTRPWLHWVGAKMGREKAGWFSVADVVFNPGAVGLHVLDSFCAGVPMVTTSEARHGPEIAYLKHDINGLIVAGDPSRYADAVIGLLQDQAMMARLRSAALADSQRYTLDNMVERFADGIERCLAMEKKR
jgi:glycosyltransferase involved in cell wall biosynthesis